MERASQATATKKNAMYKETVCGQSEHPQVPIRAVHWTDVILPNANTPHEHSITEPE